MDTAIPQICPFILDRNLAKANCRGNRVCTSCDTVVLAPCMKRWNNSSSISAQNLREGNKFLFPSLRELELNGIN